MILPALGARACLIAVEPPTFLISFRFDPPQHELGECSDR